MSNEEEQVSTWAMSFWPKGSGQAVWVGVSGEDQQAVEETGRLIRAALLADGLRDRDLRLVAASEEQQ